MAMEVACREAKERGVGGAWVHEAQSAGLVLAGLGEGQLAATTGLLPMATVVLPGVLPGPGEEPACRGMEERGAGAGATRECEARLAGLIKVTVPSLSLASVLFTVMASVVLASAEHPWYDTVRDVRDGT